MKKKSKVCTEFSIGIDVQDAWKAESMLQKAKIAYTKVEDLGQWDFYLNNKSDKDKAFKVFNSGKG